ncbi:hypothetical protein MRX96_006539 [Rhipicephalus microplus]
MPWLPNGVRSEPAISHHSTFASSAVLSPGKAREMFVISDNVCNIILGRNRLSCLLGGLALGYRPERTRVTQQGDTDAGNRSGTTKAPRMWPGMRAGEGDAQ